MRGGDLAQRQLASRPGIGEDDVEGSALGLHRRVEPVEIGLIGDRALHGAGLGAKLGQGRVERVLPAAEDEDEGAFLDETPGRGTADAGGAAGDHGGLAIQSVHVLHPLLVLQRSWECAHLGTSMHLLVSIEENAGPS